MPPEDLHNLVYTALHVGTYLIHDTAFAMYRRCRSDVLV